MCLLCACACSCCTSSRPTQCKHCVRCPLNPVYMRLPDQVHIVESVYISWCASLGCLARLYTDDIKPSNIAFQGSLLSNAVGSFLLGILKASDLNEGNLPHLYSGLTVGFCGSYTTYSGWNLRIVRAALRDADGPGGNIVAIVSILLTLAFFAVCFVAGGDFAKMVTDRLTTQRRGTRSGSTSKARAFGVMFVLYGLLALLLIFDTNGGRRSDWIAAMFAPLGALSRLLLSRLLNERWCEGAFPTGTFVANVTGSLALGLLSYGAEGDLWTGWAGRVIKGFEGGFLGCLTTMSSFMGEVVGHREKHGPAASYAYLTATVVSSLVIVLVIGVILGDSPALTSSAVAS